jgi:predicted RNase H-like HicB family nuclease
MADALRRKRFAFHVPLWATVYEAQEGGFWAEVPTLPGCFAEGATLLDLHVNLGDAARLWLDNRAAPAAPPA